MSSRYPPGSHSDPRVTQGDTVCGLLCPPWLYITVREPWRESARRRERREGCAAGIVLMVGRTGFSWGFGRFWTSDTAATFSDSRCLTGQIAGGRGPDIPRGLIVHGGD